jgi:Zn-dependent protease with chaperone function
MTQCTVCGLFNPLSRANCVSCGTPLGPIVAASAATAGVVAVPDSVETPVVDTGPSSTFAPPPPRPVREYAPILGPADRESFFAAQRRHRRATWKLTAVCALAAVVTGIPLSLALTPVIYALVVIITKLVDLVAYVPESVWDAYRWTGLTLVRVGDYYIEEEMVGPAPVAETIAVAAIWLLPGVLLMLFVWPILRRLFRSAGVGGVLMSLGAREPDLTDLEERQLVNVIEEMAIAAGQPAPGVMLLDAPVANAAVVGSSARDAVIVVSRPLLDDLNRDETQGVLAHLIAAIGNGDLRVALSVVAIFQTFGFAGAVLRAPISREARGTLWRMLRYVFSRHHPEQKAEEARQLSNLLTGGLWEQDSEFGKELDEGLKTRQRPGPRVQWLMFLPFGSIALFVAGVLLGFTRETFVLVFGLIAVLALAIIWYQRVYVFHMIRHALAVARTLAMLPYYIATMMPQILLMILIPFMLEPLLGLLWRTRRYLADARAVQLTRNPDGVAFGLRGLVTRGGGIPGGKWATPLFVVGSEPLAAQQLDPEMVEQIRRAREQHRAGLLGDARAFAEYTQSARVATIEQMVEEEGSERSFTGSTSGAIAGFHPGLNRRLKRLRRMGATAADLKGPSKADMVYSKTFGGLMMALVVVLIAIAAVLMVVVVVLMLAISLAACALLMLMVYGLLMVLAP